MIENGTHAVATIVDYRDRNDYRRRDDDRCLEEMIANGVQRLQHDVADQSSKVGDKINAAMAQDGANARSIEHMLCGMERNLAEGQREVQHTVKESQCSIEKEVVQNRFETVQSENRIIRQLDFETDMLKKDLWDFRSSVDHQFCEVRTELKDSERRILDRLTSDKLDEKNDEIARLRAKCARQEDNIIIAQELNGLKTLINSVDQNQKFYSKTVQFGAGNVALPTQTANQG